MTKISFLETREKKENFDIKILIFIEELDFLWVFQNQSTKNHQNKGFGQILVYSSRKSHVSRKLTINSNQIGKFHLVYL